MVDKLENTMLANNLISVLEAVFQDINEYLQSRACDCDNHDASKALYEVTSALNMMDTPYLVREALGVPHPGDK